MPHKRAKSSVRQTQRKEQGADLVPTSKDSILNEAIPKSAQRILNAQSIRDEYHKKRKAQAEEKERDAKKRKTGLKILPGESIQHFNRRVEDDLRPLVKTAMESGRAVARKAQREEMEAKAAKKNKGKGKGSSTDASTESKAKPKRKQSPNDDAESESDSPPSKKSKSQKATPTPNATHSSRPVKDFASASTSAPKRLNDIAMAPPELKKLGKGGAQTNFKLGKVTGEQGTKAENVVSMAQKVMMEQEREGAIRRYREMKAMRAAGN